MLIYAACYLKTQDVRLLFGIHKFQKNLSQFIEICNSYRNTFPNLPVKVNWPSSNVRYEKGNRFNLQKIINKNVPRIFSIRAVRQIENSAGITSEIIFQYYQTLQVFSVPKESMKAHIFHDISCLLTYISIYFILIIPKFTSFSRLFVLLDGVNLSTSHQFSFG